jgi:hypothetical protein
MLLAAGALTALAFAVLPAGAAATEMESHCSAAPCEGAVESTGITVLTDDSGLGLQCGKTTGTVTQTAATSTTVSVLLTLDECKDPFGGGCQNEGAGTAKIVTNTMTGHLITVTTGKPETAGILLTGVNITFECTFAGKKTVTGNIIGTFENTSEFCGKATTHHTISFTQSSSGQQTDKTWTGSSFDLLSSGTTASQTATCHVKYAGGKTVTITC